MQIMGFKGPSDDMVNLNNLLSSLSLQLSSSVKMLTLGLNTAKKPRPLKVCYRSKKEVDDIVSSYASAIRNDLQTLANFCLSRDRTSLEHEVLHGAYAELDQRRGVGELNIKVSFINSVPSVVKSIPKNRVRVNNIDR